MNEPDVVRQAVHSDPIDCAVVLPVRDEELDLGIVPRDDAVAEHALLDRRNGSGRLLLNTAVTEFTRYSKFAGMARVIEGNGLLRRGTKRPTPCSNEYQYRNAGNSPSAQNHQDPTDDGRLSAG